MCIIIINKHKTLSESVIYNSWENNPDGAGMAWVEHKELLIHKEMNDYVEFYNKYLEVRSVARGAVMLHFRIGTSGVKNIANTHPFMVNEHLAFCHNGILPDMGGSEFSDTVEFNETILKQLPKGFEKNPAFIKLISKAIGTNKFAFLDNKGKATIIHSELGINNKDGDWFSNSSYLQRAYSYSAYYGGAYSKGYSYYKSKKSKKYDNDYTCSECGAYIYTDRELEYGMCGACLYDLGIVELPQSRK